MLLSRSTDQLDLDNSKAGPGGPRAAIPDPISWPAARVGLGLLQAWQATRLASGFVSKYVARCQTLESETRVTTPCLALQGLLPLLARPVQLVSWALMFELLACIL